MLRLLLALVIALAACERGATSEPSTHTAVLDINQATAQQLEVLPGIGPERARRIVAAREARGGKFTTLEEVAEIDGIGPLTLDRIRPLIQLGPPGR